MQANAPDSWKHIEYLASWRQNKKWKHPKDRIDEALATAQHTLRWGVHTILGSSLRALVFNQDMFLGVPLIANWQILTEKREHLIDKTLHRANMKRRQYNYEINQKIETITIHKPSKLEKTWMSVQYWKVYCNGNLTIKLRQNVTERLNIHRVMPYHERETWWIQDYSNYETWGRWILK